MLLTVTLAVAGCGAGGDDSDQGSGSGGDRAAGAQASQGPADGSGALTDESGARDGAKADSDRAGSGKERAGGDTRNPSGPLRAADTHIIRTASLTVRVKDVPRALERARTAAEDAGGLVGDESTDRDRRGHDRSRVVLRVPQDRYEQVLSDLAGTGKLISRTAKAEDVTEEVVDVESRIRTQRASVARVRALMDKATKISDIVSLEGELSGRQADLEALLARQSSLKDRTTMATITLTLTESPQAGADGKDDDPTFTGALSGGWSAFVTMLGWLAVALAAALPFAAVSALLVLLWLRVVRPWTGRRAVAVPAGSAVGPGRAVDPGGAVGPTGPGGAGGSGGPGASGGSGTGGSGSGGTGGPGGSGGSSGSGGTGPTGPGDPKAPKASGGS
ncbi:DUF4349 domain-containing protein [Streptomyces flavofungini]|uniref:DUF4349 domain-containing protein n=1 Tax=Streptomyces flavofungini TaxID=68200 RepID=UPI001E2A49D5|nr:DUF4349 domain-containing protein [Streptomyces flavofungini]